MLTTEREGHERRLAGIRKLESRLSFRLAILQRLLDRQMGRILGRHGLSLASYRVLVTIDAFEEMAAADLVRMIAVDKALVSRSVAELTEARCLAARPDPRSGRRKLLSLTPEGAALLATVAPDVASRNAGLDSLFSPDERVALDSALDRLTRHAGASLEEDANLQPAA